MYCSNGYTPTIKPTKIELIGDDLRITLPDLTLINGKRWFLLICQKLPKGSTIGNVVFISGGEKLSAFTVIGNELKTDMIRSRRRYTLTYGWNAPHFMVGGACPSAYVPTTAA